MSERIECEWTRDCPHPAVAWVGAGVVDAPACFAHAEQAMGSNPMRYYEDIPGLTDEEMRGEEAS